MSNTLKILTIALAITISQCTLGVFLSAKIPSIGFLQCLMKNGAKFASWGEESTTAGVSAQATAALTNIKNAGLASDITFVPCHGTNPAKEVSTFVSRIPRNVFSKVWIKADDNAEEDVCRWKDNSFQQNCELMLAYVNEFRRNRINVGIMCNQEDWDQFFKTCPILAAEALFWEPEKPDGNPSFADFKPFGDWKQPARKLYDFV